MKLPFPYARWERAASEDGATDLRAQGAAEHVNGDGVHFDEFSAMHVRHIERLTAALHDESGRISANSVNDLIAFDSIAAEIASVLEDHRRECAAIVESRSTNGSKRRS